MKTLKQEEVDGRNYRDLEHAREAIGAFIEDVATDLGGPADVMVSEIVSNDMVGKAALAGIGARR